MSQRRIKVIVPPVKLHLDGAEVTIVEVAPYTTLDKKVRYLVACKVKLGSKESPVFHVDAETNYELEQKLRAEIAKFVLANIVG